MLPLLVGVVVILQGDFMLQNVQAILLAAGKSRRFNTNKTKLLESICGQSMILYQTKLLADLMIPTTLVIGHQKELIKNAIKKEHNESIAFIEQDIQAGTGHALKCTQHLWTHENVLVMNGDTPLITLDILEKLYQHHISTDSAITFVTAHNDDPNNSYGRVIKKDDTIEIIEACHLQDKAEHCCINAGIYLFKKSFLNTFINNINSNELTKEYYITDLIKVASTYKHSVEIINAPFDYIRGVNTLEELWACEQIKRSELIRSWMKKGVRFTAAQNVQIDISVSIGAGSCIGSGVHLIGKTSIGKNCTIDAFSIIENSSLEDHVTIHPHSLIKNTKIAKNASVGPFAYTRNNSFIDTQAQIGTFVEIKNSTIGSSSKARHLTYLGDTTLGTFVNIGAGTITANYDGVKKHTTIIEDGTHIGANNSLVAPITLGKNSYTAAGSTLTKNVPADALAIARTRQINKEQYAKKILAKDQKNNLKESKSEGKNKEQSTEFVAAIQITSNSDL